MIWLTKTWLYLGAFRTFDSLAVAGVFYSATSTRRHNLLDMVLDSLWVFFPTVALVVFQLPPEAYFFRVDNMFGLQSSCNFSPWIWIDVQELVKCQKDLEDLYQDSDWIHGICQTAKPFRLCQHRHLKKSKAAVFPKIKTEGIHTKMIENNRYEESALWNWSSYFRNNTGCDGLKMSLLWSLSIYYVHIILSTPSLNENLGEPPVAGNPNMSRLWWIWDRRWIRIRALWSTSAQVH